MINLEERILKSASAIQDDLVKHRRYLHQHPELSLDLPLTTKYVKERLIEMGYSPIDCGKSGILVTAGGKNPGKVFLIRGDMDALPIKEETDLEFRSTNNNMHACGHDLHTSMMLGAAKLLKDMENDIHGTVKLMFQPAEETLQGAKVMIDAGILENPNVDAAMMIHVMSGFPVPAGTIILPSPGIGSAASDWFEIHVKGKGGHGAIPDSTIDPLNIAAHIHIALQAINSRELPPSETAVLTIGMMKGGTTSNVIPDTAELHGTIRTFDQSIRDLIKKRIVEISDFTAKSFRGTAEVKIIDGCPSLSNDKNLVESAEIYFSELFGEQTVLSMSKLMPGVKMSGSEDFGYVSEKVPTIMLAVAAGESADNQQYPMHHPKVRFDDSVLYRGAAAYACMAVRWLQDNEN